jgi:inositol transport system substrate-binding protein
MNIKKRKLFILLTSFPNTVSRAIRFWTGFSYSHASIGLEEDLNTFYSFAFKGFMIEKITRFVRPGRTPYPCMLYELEVSEAVYQDAQNILSEIISRRKHLRYTKRGAILSLLQIHHRREGHYFCSHFVAEVLQKSRAARLKKASNLYLPQDFEHLHGVRKIFQGNLRDMIRHFYWSPYSFSR